MKHLLSLVIFFVYGSVSPIANAQSVAAFVKPDPATKTLPTKAFQVQRDGKIVNTNGALESCDVVTFVPNQSSPAVWVTTLKSGKDVKLDAKQAQFKVACENPGLSELARSVWVAISGGKRAETSTPISEAGSAVTTRKDDLQLPIFAAPQSKIVEGRRSLFVSWSGGNAPYTLRLQKYGADLVLAQVQVANKTHATLPALDLEPGRYRLTLSETTPAGTISQLVEDSIFVVSKNQAPALPRELQNARLQPDEIAIVYVMYMEGLGKGEWAFEAMQHANENFAKSAWLQDWMLGYGGRF